MDPEVGHPVGIGATETLSLRISVATLVKVLFKNPDDGEWTLALERKATLGEMSHAMLVDEIAQPFGGAIRILNLTGLHSLVGNFHFDSDRSRSESDFRLFIQPSHWPAWLAFCIEHLNRAVDSILETDPGRELKEELFDALKIHIIGDQYITKPIGLVIEDQPRPTENPRTPGYPTTRIYHIFEATITDPVLAQALMENSEGISDQALRKRAFEDGQSGGRGRANAVLALPLTGITAFYGELSPRDRNRSVIFKGHQLDETVAAVLEGIDVPKYQRL